MNMSNHIRRIQHLCHTHLVGVADPTFGLPPNTVCMSGIKHGDIDVDENFFTRKPCLEPRDVRMIKVITMKPDDMSQAVWDWLGALHLGAPIFANPKTGQRPLPKLIGDGDLDGDLYFVCWEKIMFSHLRRLPITDDELQLSTYNEDNGITCYDPDWFEKAQVFISNGSNMVDVHDLTGCLYKLSEAIAMETSITDPYAIAFAIACKQALEFKKHGRRMCLSAHLFDNVPKISLYVKFNLIV
jgi:hypothetical protein